MRRLLVVLIAIGVVAGGVGILILFLSFFTVRSALETPSGLAVAIADLGKELYIVPSDVKNKQNPEVAKPNAVANGQQVYASHCAICHGVDGKGKTVIGQNLFPPAADLTGQYVQSKSEGYLYWITLSGLPHTGMPGWKRVLSEAEIWQVVAYLRVLPKGPIVSGQTPTPTIPRPTTVTSPTPTTESPPATNQVTQGQQVYAQSCQRCHGANLEGGSGTALTLVVLSKYQTADRLVGYLSKQMPANRPGSLSEQQYYDVTAFILDRRGFLPAGQVLTPANAAQLNLRQ